MHYLVCYSWDGETFVERKYFQLETQPEDWKEFLNQNGIELRTVHFILQSDKPFMDVIQDN